MIAFPENWKMVKINNVCEYIVDCINKTAPVVDHETPYKMIRTTNVKQGRVNLDSTRFVTEQTFTKWNRRLTPQKNDIVLTREAPLGDIGLIRSNDKVMLGQRTMLYRANPEILDQNFLYYSLLGGILQSQIRMYGSGSTVEHMRVPDAEKLELPLPPLSVQKKIASMLTSYDDLIGVNNRRIQLLEDMAEEIYKEWFVRLRFPEYENVKVVKGLPKGWKLQPISALVEINPKEKVDPKQIRPYVGMDRLSEQYMYFDSKESRKSTAGAKFRNNDVIFPRITPCLENGKRGYVFCLGQDEVAVGSTEFIVFREQQLPSEYIYLLTCYQPFRRHAENFMVGASGRQRVSADCFDFFFLPLPPKDLLDSFVDKVKPFFEQIKNLQLENKNLVETRDKLLPRLISGKLSVENLDINFPPSMEEALA